MTALGYDCHSPSMLLGVCWDAAAARAYLEPFAPPPPPPHSPPAADADARAENGDARAAEAALVVGVRARAEAAVNASVAGGAFVAALPPFVSGFHK